MRPRSVGAPDSSPSFPNAPLVTELLLLDDDPLQLKLLARALNGLGYHDVVGCTTAAVALDALNAPERTIGLIFLDLNMPDVDGVAFLRLLAESHRSIPVVLVSGEDERLVETAARLGASHQLTVLGTLPKPVWPVELRALLARWESPAPAASGAPTAYAAGDVTRAVRHGELVNYYQPKVDLVTGTVAGVEALVRWRHPLHGDVLPGRFLGVVEEHGLISELTRVVIGAALSVLVLGVGIRWFSQRRLRLQVAALERDQAVNRERARIARNMHDDVGASLTQIGLLSELARNGNGRYYVVGGEKNDSFARQLAGAFRPAAENVKVQVNFNPQRVRNGRT